MSIVSKYEVGRINTVTLQLFSPPVVKQVH